MRYMSEKPITMNDINPEMPTITVRAVTFHEADMICKALGGVLPSREDFDAFGDIKLANDQYAPVWSWSTEIDAAERVLRGGSWGHDHQDVLSAAGRLTDAPSTRYSVIGFRCVWARKADIPRHIRVIKIPGSK